MPGVVDPFTEQREACASILPVGSTKFTWYQNWSKQGKVLWFLNLRRKGKPKILITCLLASCRCARRGLLDCVHCTQLEDLSSGRCGGIFGAHSDSYSFCPCCYHSHSCGSFRSSCMEAVHVGVVCIQCNLFYRNENYIKMKIIVSLTQPFDSLGLQWRSCIVLYCIYSAFKTSMRRIENIVNIQHTDNNKYIKFKLLNTKIKIKRKI
jgi:hypothetical protein